MLRPITANDFLITITPKGRTVKWKASNHLLKTFLGPDNENKSIEHVNSLIKYYTELGFLTDGKSIRK